VRAAIAEIEADNQATVSGDELGVNGAWQS
jgi:hypothetical protein